MAKSLKSYITVQPRIEHEAGPGSYKVREGSKEHRSVLRKELRDTRDDVKAVAKAGDHVTAYGLHKDAESIKTRLKGYANLHDKASRKK